MGNVRKSKYKKKDKNVKALIVYLNKIKKNDETEHSINTKRI